MYVSIIIRSIWSRKRYHKKELIKRMDNVESLPSFTDRSPREGEKDGQAYHFISTEKFKEMIDNGELYEYDVHHNHYYGTSKNL